MIPKKKTLSNPFSTGGGGVHFEAHVQASFVALMLTGGHAPCLPCWPITEIKLQGKINGIDTDDLVVVVENIHNKEQRKLLGQIKHSISITKGNILFGQVIHDAWSDFKNPKLFTRNKDIIALITGPISANDAHNVLWLLNQARHTKNANEFFRNVQQVKFSPPKSSEKLEVIQYHLNSANGGKDVSKDEIYEFLNHFHLLGYDVGTEFGVVLSLLHSHISQYKLNEPKWVWSRVVDIVQTWNQDAGTITPSKLPEDLLEAFKQRAITEIPSEFKALKENHKMDWNNHSDATYLALAILIGSWQDKSQCDLEVITQLLGINYDEWLKKARVILQYQDSPLSFRNGIWKVVNRSELWKLLGSRILDQNIDTFRSLAISVLKEPDPAFKLSPEERYTASINGKVLNCSAVIRKGIAEGLAILGSQHESCIYSSQGNAELTCVLVLRELLTDADWILWGSLNSLLPTLAEAAPVEFLDAVEKAMLRSPCPFDDLFYQEGNGITGSNYLTGLLWALECLAWDEQYLVRVCLVLGELARHDPGGHWSNRPSNSLSTILLPWLPQTLASVDKRKVAVQTILKEWPDVAWNLIIQLLPGKHQTSFESYKPNWRKIIPDNWRKGVTQQEYWAQSSYYAALAVDAAGQDTARLSELIDHFDILPDTAFNKLLQSLTSMSILELPEEQRLLIWDHLTKFTNKHRRNSDEKWAFPNEIITRIENVAEQLAPTDPINLYQYLFADRDFDLYEENGNWEEQRKKLEIRREKGISEVIQQAGVEGVIRFAESVSKPVQVGFAFGLIADTIGEQTLLPAFLDSEDNKRKDLVNGFIWRRYLLKGWEWCDNLDKSGWKQGQIGQFLAYLPFSKETWDRALKWLQSHESEYWTRTSVNAYHAGDDLTFAIEKLLEHGRPHAAINCLDQMHHGKWPIDSNQCIRALLEAPSSNESFTNFDSYNIIELIKFLQAEPSVNEDDLFKVEWAYLPLLDRHNGVAPKILESRLAGDPEFFCTLIKLIYRSNKVDQPLRELSEGSKAIAKNAWRLLHEWNTPPGTQKDGMFSDVQFINWLQRVKEVCLESGHLEVAFINIGEVLIHTPPDSDGLWINRTVATALNDREANDMRDGFFTGAYNSRGVHWVDPTGKPEREHAEQFRRKAEELENAGFHRFCVTLKKLANTYDREAERIVSDHEQTGDD